MPRRLVGKDAPALGASLSSQFPNTEVASFSNRQLLLRSNFSYSKHYRTGNAETLSKRYDQARIGTSQNLVTTAAGTDSIFQ